MVNLEYLEQLVNSVDRAIQGYDNAIGEEKEKIKKFVLSITSEINKILSGK